MAPELGGKGKAVSLDADYIESALSLLSSETSKEKPDLRKLFIEIFFFLNVGFIFNGVITGLITIWTNRTIGMWAFIASGIAFAISTVLIIWKSTEIMPGRRTEERSELTQLASIALNRASQGITGVIGIAFLVWIGSIIWLVYSVIADHNASLPAIILVFFASLLWFIFSGVQRYQEQRYFSNVLRLRDRLEALSTQPETRAADSYSVSSQDMSILGQVTQKKIDKAIRDLPTLKGKLYYLSKSDNVRKNLKSLPEEDRGEVIDIIDSLEVNPEPPTAKPVSGQPGMFSVHGKKYNTVYSVDNTEHRINVISVQPADLTGGTK